MLYSRLLADTCGRSKEQKTWNINSPKLFAHHTPPMEGLDPTDLAWGEDDGVWPGITDVQVATADDTRCNTGREHSDPTNQSHFSDNYGASNNSSMRVKVKQPSANQIPAGPPQVLGSEDQDRFQDATKPQVLPVASQSRAFQNSPEPPASVSVASGKRKHLHMDSQDCSDLAQTEMGAMALKNPSMVRKSSKDSNRGLYPRLPKSRGMVHTSHFSSKSEKRSPSKIALSKEQMKNQTTMDRFFPVSPCKKATPIRPSPGGLHQQSPHLLAPSSLSTPATTASTSPFPKKNLNCQFASMGPTSSFGGQAGGNRTLTTHQFKNSAGPSSVSHSASIPTNKPFEESQFVNIPSQQTHRERTPTKMYSTTTNRSNHPQFQSQSSNPSTSVGKSSKNTLQPSSPCSQERILTKMYAKPNQSPCPSPAKSAKSAVDSDIEVFFSDNSRDGFGAEMASTPPNSENFVKPSPPSSQESISVKMFPKSAQNPSLGKPTKNTTDNDIEDFQNDNSLDGFDFDQLNPSPSKSVGSTVNSDIEAFENDSYFDSIDPELLGAESIPSQPSSQSGVSNPPNTFGLLGEGSTPGCSWDEDQASMQGFDSLPLEVLEKVFCFVPMTDVYLHLSLVCKRWHGIISTEDFMPWKKTYHLLRMKSLTEVPEKMNLIPHDREENEDMCLLGLVRCMPKFKARYGATMNRDLQKHPKYVLAKDIMKARAPELLQIEEANPWSAICLLVLLSETVQDVSRILECLLHQTASCTTMEVLECLYCIAAYLWKYKINFSLNGGCHYRVYHALYLFENSHASVPLPTDSSSGDTLVNRHPLALSRRSFPPTHEQCRIINHDIARGDVVKIVAFAGTGKTTTLVRYAERRPNTAFLYVAFNKSVMNHATEIFPHNVTSRTTHSLAFRAVGWKYKQKLDLSLNPFHVHKLLPVRKSKELPWLRYSSLVCKTLQRFCASASDFITTQHVPSDYVTHTQKGDMIASQRHILEHPLKMNLSDDAGSVWKRMINPKDTEARITHDVYLKLYQLSKPRNLDYDCLLIDEAQDLTPAQQDILLNQSGSKILVGDPNQQIYSFRGATDAMNRVHSEKTFHLTQSFRFGTEIAYIANCLLERATKNRAGPQPMLIGTREPGCIDGDEIGKLAIITRSNVTLFTEAVNIVLAGSMTTIGFAGGIEGYGMDVILDIYQLQQPENKRGFIKNKHIWTHKNFGVLKHYANETDNGELLNKIKIVDTYNIRIPELVDKIRSRTRLESMADIVLTTAHKAKGLEFDTVKITDDYGISQARLTPLCVLERDELNMVYVAVTRAKKSLVLTKSLITFISGQPTLEKFIYPAPATSLRSEGESPSFCTECQQPVPGDCVVLLKKKSLKMAYSSARQQGGILCPRCSVEMQPSFRCFFPDDALPSSQE